ncbi:uncharacterized protein [Mytilus edulis]|uniref:uncharacterized protein n=1 Tax=Mytilus edulis TaxID=6550 RepID=UPI0039EF5D44
MDEDEEAEEYAFTGDEVFAITKEEENLVRIFLLAKVVAPKAVRKYFDQLFEPTALKNILHNNYYTLHDLWKKRILNQSQWNLLFPKSGESTSELFDISLMVCLLRNIMGIAEPIIGWNDLPPPKDIGVGADLMRIKIYRNDLAHLDCGAVNDTYFKDAWKEISGAVGRLGGRNLKRECKMFRVKPLQGYNRDLIKKELVSWKCNDENFVETDAANYIIEKCKEFNFLTIVGNSGVGKTATLQHVGLVLKDEGYEVIPVTTCKDIIRYNNSYPNRPTVFMCDDFCGTCSLNQNRFQQWKDRIGKLNLILNAANTKIIVTSRSQIYRDEIFKTVDLFNLCVCDFSSNELRLTDPEKYAIAKEYTGEIAGAVFKYSGAYDFFPLLCKLYSTNPSVAQLDNYFHNPFQAYKAELDNMLVEGGKEKYCALALCVVFNNYVVEHDLTTELNPQFRKVIDNVCNACRLSSGISQYTLRDEMETLKGSFLKKENGVYSTIHDKLFDFISNYFLNAMVECLLQNASSSFISERLLLHKPIDSTDTLCSVVPMGFKLKLIRRIFDDWCKGRIEDVFLNTNFDVPFFRAMFIVCLNSLDLEVQKVLASTHSEHGNSPLIQCCFIGDIDLLDRLFYLNVDVNKCRKDGASALFVACQEGNLEIATKLLERHAVVNQQLSDGATPLFIACQNGHLPIVKLLLQSRADVDRRTRTGSSPIIVSSVMGHKDIVEGLLYMNARVDFKIKNDNTEETAMSLAKQNRHYEIVRMLKDNDRGVVARMINIALRHKVDWSEAV